MKTGCYSRFEIESFIPPKDSVLICISDPEPYNPPKVNRAVWDRVSYHYFWDVERKLAIGYEPATEKDLAWLKECVTKAMSETKHCFVSCEAGISRSSAVREYLIQHGYTYISRQQQDRMVHPNQYVLNALNKENTNVA